MNSGNSLSLITTVSVVGIGMVTSVLFSRLMGPEGRGMLAAAQLWPVLLLYLSIMGFLDAVVVFSARDDSRLNEILGNALVVTISVALVVVAVGYWLLPIVLRSQDPSVVRASRILLLGMPLQAIGDVFTAVVQGRGAWRAYSILRFTVPAGLLFGTLLLYSSGHLTVIGVILVQVVFQVLRLIGSIGLAREVTPGTRLRVDFPLMKQMVVFGGKSHVGAMAEHVNDRLDQAIIAARMPPGDLGLYVSAVSASSLVKILSQSLKVTTLPTIASQATIEDQRTQLIRSFRLYWLASIMIAPVLAICLYWMIPFVFGADFKNAYLPAVILTIGALLFGAKDILSASAKAMGLPGLGSKAELIAMVITVGILLALIGPLGITGAAVASAGAYAAALLVVIDGLAKSASIRTRDLFLVSLRDYRELKSELASRIR